MKDIQQQLDEVVRGTAEIISLEGLRAKLDLGRPLRVKAGFDPTAPDIHLGHVVLLRKLRQFQDLGHQVLFLIGDFTAQIGDPSGKDQLRPRMTAEVVAENAQTYRDQVFKVLDPDQTTVVFNSEWLSRMTSEKMLALTAHSTVAQMLARADFKKRIEEQKEISLLEFFYPLLQGYDSFHLSADVELGGSDQKFNLLMGRQLQEAYKQEPQVVIMTPLLEGTDGEKKMSKSLQNYIGINEPPRNIVGKVMSVSDALMLRYYEVLTDRDLAEVKRMHPKQAKLALAGEIVEQFYDSNTAREACAEFEKIFSRGQQPKEMPEFKLPSDNPPRLAEILLQMNLAASRNEVRRLLQQGAVSWEGESIADEAWPVQRGVIKIGKRRFLKII